jgi:hypothetical protein
MVGLDGRSAIRECARASAVFANIRANYYPQGQRSFQQIVGVALAHLAAAIEMVIFSVSQLRSELSATTLEDFVHCLSGYSVVTGHIFDG